MLHNTLILGGYNNPRGSYAPTNLETVRDELLRQFEGADPVDYERDLRNVHMSFHEGGPWFAWLNTPGERIGLTAHALGQLARDVLPAHGLGVFNELASLDRADERGARLATMAWQLFNQARDNGTRRVFRTMLVNGERVCRAVVSTRFATYDDLEFVEDLLEAVGPAPVLRWHRQDTGLTIRFRLDGKTEAPALREPVLLGEGWNSEVGRRSVGLQGGIWKLICTNGATIRDGDSTSGSWNHSGNVDRIGEAIRGVVADIQIEAGGVRDAYNVALRTAIDDELAFMEQTMRPHMTIAQYDATVAALDHETTTPNRRLLAAVFDAATWAAQSETDMWAQADMEQVAIRAMRGGIARRDDDGRIRTRSLALA